MYRAGRTPEPLSEVVRESRATFWAIALFSSVVNILMLAGPLYMLQIYDRVLSSGSVPTLIALSMFVLGAYVFQGILDVLRQRITVRIASVFDEKLQNIVHKAVVTLGIIARQPGEAMGPIRNVDTIRAFATSTGPSAMLDAPWVPIYLVIVFLGQLKNPQLRFGIDTWTVTERAGNRSSGYAGDIGKFLHGDSRFGLVLAHSNVQILSTGTRLHMRNCCFERVHKVAEILIITKR